MRWGTWICPLFKTKCWPRQKSRTPRRAWCSAPRGMNLLDEKALAAETLGTEVLLTGAFAVGKPRFINGEVSYRLNAEFSCHCRFGRVVVREQLLCGGVVQTPDAGGNYFRSCIPDMHLLGARFVEKAGDAMGRMTPHITVINIDHYCVFDSVRNRREFQRKCYFAFFVGGSHKCS